MLDCVVVFNCEVVCVCCICKVIGVYIYCETDCVYVVNWWLIFLFFETPHVSRLNI